MNIEKLIYNKKFFQISMEILPNDNKNLSKNWERIVETHQAGIKLQLERKLSDEEYYDDDNTEDVELMMRYDFYPEITINEDATYVPRFSVKKYTNPLFAQFPPNKELKYSRDLMMMAINYGMILQVQYRGEKDDFVQGRQRVIYPMVLGTSAKGKPLLRCYHLKGWSVSNGGKIDKVWRMFRTDRIMSMSFTGHFFRLPPAGYNMTDKGMRGGIIVAADFDKIRNNQKSLIQKNLIQNKEQVNIQDTIQVEKTDTILNLKEPFANPNINEDDKKYIRLTFLKSTQTNHYIAILGALGEKNKIVKVTYQDKYLGQYKVLKWIMGDQLGKPHLNKVENQSDFDLFIFVKKLNNLPSNYAQVSPSTIKPKVEPKKEEPVKQEPEKKPTKFEELSKKINKMGQVYNKATQDPKTKVEPEKEEPKIVPPKPTKFEEMSKKINQMGKQKPDDNKGI